MFVLDVQNMSDESALDYLVTQYIGKVENTSI